MSPIRIGVWVVVGGLAFTNGVSIGRCQSLGQRQELGYPPKPTVLQPLMFRPSERVGLFAPTPRPISDEPSQSCGADSPQPPSASQQEEVEVLNQIRQRIGGVESRLRHLMPPDQAESIFRAELARLQNQNSLPHTESSLIPSLSGPLPGHSDRSAKTWPPLPDHESESVSTGRLAPQQMHEQSQIRMLARQLEMVAEQLEGLSRYEAADGLRREAQHLRESVRWP